MADGHLNLCKECHKAKSQARRRDDPDRAREADRRKYLKRRNQHLAKCKEYREQNKEAIRDYQRQWYEENREEKAEYHRQWYERNRETVKSRVQKHSKTERGKEVHARAIKTYAERYPEKVAANHAVNNAIRDRRLVRETCQVCGAEAQAHHEDYSKPLDVLWLCPEHHAELHAEIRAAV